MAENQPFLIADSIRDARERVAVEFGAHAEKIQKLNQDLAELQQSHAQTEQETSRQWDELARGAAMAAAAQAKIALENVLNAVRALMTSTIPEQVFAVLTEEASHWGVRAAVFDVRGKAAWGASAAGFGRALPERVVRSLVVPLNQDNPFRQVCETAGHVDASTDTLKKNRNVVDKLKPAPHAPVLLLPVRSAGTVAAILYADSGDKGDPLPVTALTILAEFAGAQIDRLIALSGATADEAAPEAPEPISRNVAIDKTPDEVASQEPVPTELDVSEPPPVESPARQSAAEEPAGKEDGSAFSAEVEVVASSLPEPEPAASPAAVAGEPEPMARVVTEAQSEPSAPAVEPPAERIPAPLPMPFSPAESVAEAATLSAATAPAGLEDAPPSEAEQKLQKDAKRFAKLLVSEIELYNKAKVADGRTNRDLYKRLKSDIDRSRQTFEKRFGKVLNKQVDYFHDELVRILAANDTAVLGPEYPGPPA